ncbi:MAG: hypothetical protein AAF378_01365 [Cyanobacteria bacterium P01_A01_bin.84]
MQHFFKSAAIVSAVSTITLACSLLSANPAQAKPKGMPEGYIGAGVGFNDSGAAAGLNGRISFPKTKVSVRGSLYADCASDVCAALFIPTVTYDIPLANNSNLYVGGGIATASISDGVTSLSGTAGALQVGAETGIGKKVVFYGDGTFFNGVSLWKAGLGYRF